MLKIFFFVTLIIICALANNSIYAAQYDKNNNFNIAVAADWGSAENAKKTVQNIQSKNPEIVIANGDLSYKKSANCWLEMIQPLKSKMKIAMGDHEYSDTSGGAIGVINQYLKPLNLQKTYYSFDINNLHVTIIDPFIDYKPGSAQYKFIDNDLKTASTNPNIDWIFAVQSTPMYTSPSKHPSDYKITDTYYPLFDKYDVDLVLSSDNHNYQRTFPLDYHSSSSGAASSDNPTIVNKNQKNYHSINYNNYKDDDKNGVIYLITGTAGRSLYELEGQAPFIAKQDDKHFGFLNIEISDKTLKGTFYANENKLPQNYYSDYHNNNNNNIIDEFTISKTNEQDTKKA
ncbi:MAG TPA: metallophosphoesterase [Nitrososphaeraceae archaeon]|nr:metallophosphoesterase [Nitrososphaeraceae archaeon]